MTSNLFFNPEKLDILEIYVYYDRPLLFACRDLLEHIYLATLISEEDDFEEWLYVELSSKRFQEIRAGLIDLYDAFKFPENNFVYKVRISEEIRTSVVQHIDIDESWLPNKGETINITSKPRAIIDFKGDPQKLRESILLNFTFPNFLPGEAPVETLGEILTSIQGTINQIGLALFNNPIPLLFTKSTQGSFEIEIQSQEQIDLLGETKASKAFEKLLTILNLDNDPTELIKELNNLSPETAKNYLRFIKSISGTTKETKIKWISPILGLEGSAIITKQIAQSIIESISQAEIKEIKINQIYGKLRAINLDTPFFSIVTESGTKFSGEITKDALDSITVQSAQINKIYEATIEVKQELNPATGGITTRKSLIKLEFYFSQ